MPPLPTPRTYGACRREGLRNKPHPPHPHHSPHSWVPRPHVGPLLGAGWLSVLGKSCVFSLTSTHSLVTLRGPSFQVPGRSRGPGPPLTAAAFLQVIQEVSGLPSEGASEGNQYTPEAQRLNCQKVRLCSAWKASPIPFLLRKKLQV